MKTPDKLYCMHRLSDDYSCSTTPFGGSVEYIHKDILLKWAKHYKSLHAATYDPVVWGQRNMCQQLIDKLNSM